jgi:hypothetical protein
MKKNQSATKKTNVAKAKKETKVLNVEKINLSALTDRLQKIDVKEKQKKQTIYLYPETFTDKDINSEVGKKFRNKRRKEIERFANNCFFYMKYNRENDLIKEVDEFEKHYKTFYKINDYSVKSISNSKETNNIELFLDIVKATRK